MCCENGRVSWFERSVSLFDQTAAGKNSLFLTRQESCMHFIKKKKSTNTEGGTTHTSYRWRWRDLNNTKTHTSAKMTQPKQHHDPYYTKAGYTAETNPQPKTTYTKAKVHHKTWKARNIHRKDRASVSHNTTPNQDSDTIVTEAPASQEQNCHQPWATTTSMSIGTTPQNNEANGPMPPYRLPPWPQKGIMGMDSKTGGGHREHRRRRCQPRPTIY